MTTTTRSPYEERFYLDAIGSIRGGAEPAELFAGMVQIAAAFNAALKDQAFTTKAITTFQELSKSSESEARAVIEAIFAEREKAQHDYTRFAQDPAFQEEVIRRAASDEQLIPAESADPKCRLLLPGQPQAMRDKYLAIYAQSPDMTEMVRAITHDRHVADALVKTFEVDSNHLMPELTAALAHAKDEAGNPIQTPYPAEALANSFLNSRTIEAIDQQNLLALGGWISEQVGPHTVRDMQHHGRAVQQLNDTVRGG